MPAGFNPSTAFANYSTLGLTYTLGSTLTVPAGKGIPGFGPIADPVICQGRLRPFPAALSTSTMASSSPDGDGPVGQWEPDQQQSDVGDQRRNPYRLRTSMSATAATATFTQSGGANDVSNYLHIGSNAGSTARTASAATAACSANYVQVGYSGTGLFTQSGGNADTNISDLFLGCNAGARAHHLNGSGQFSAFYASTLATPARGPSRSPVGRTTSSAIPTQFFLYRLQRGKQRDIQSQWRILWASTVPSASPAREPSRSPAELIRRRSSS